MVLPAIGATTGYFVWQSRLWAVNLVSLETEWEFAADSNISRSPIVVSDTFLLTAAESGKLYALDVMTGQILWSDTIVVPEPAFYSWWSPAVAEGLIVVPSGNDLVAYSPAGGLSCTLSCMATVPASGRSNLPVAFAADGTQVRCSEAITYEWDFGDGETSNLQNPEHSYSSEGTYPWTLLASVAEVSCSKRGSITIAPGPTCDLSCAVSVPATEVPGVPIAFSSACTLVNCSDTMRYFWDFGDVCSQAFTSTLPNPSHTYFYPGTYDWNLSACVSDAQWLQRGTITIAFIPPTVSKVRGQETPFRLNIVGDNFQNGISVYIAGQSTRWSSVIRNGKTKLTILKAASLFPKDNTWVSILLVNPDSGEVTVDYNRKQKAWRPLH